MCESFLIGTPDIKEYIKDNFKEVYGGDSLNLNIITSLYREGLESSVIRSWEAIIMLTIFSVITISFYFFMGHKIMSKLSCSGNQMSKKTSDLQKKLFKALAIQTIIPICVSFAPCLLCWYAPALRIDMGRLVEALSVLISDSSFRTVNYTGVIALALFPFFDPVAIICCLPVLRNRLVPNFAVKTSVATTPNSNSL